MKDEYRKETKAKIARFNKDRKKETKKKIRKKAKE